MTEHDRASRSSSDEDISSIDDERQHTTNGNSNANGGNLEKQTTASSLSMFESRAQSAVSRIRSRDPGQTIPFNHPLSHTKTSTDVIVDFDGPDDPYRPLNWPFRKKAITTVLYGLTTMGATWASSMYVFISISVLGVADRLVSLLALHRLMRNTALAQKSVYWEPHCSCLVLVSGSQTSCTSID